MQHFLFLILLPSCLVMQVLLLIAYNRDYDKNNCLLMNFYEEERNEQENLLKGKNNKK